MWVSGRRGWKEKLRTGFTEGDRTIWVHCASLGEFEQGRPVIEKIRETDPAAKILVTFFSPSGFEVRKNWPMADHICYLPSDTPWNAAEFVRAVRPVMVVFIKYEFWGNYIHEIYNKGIPLYLVSGIFRSNQPFFKWYGRFFRDLLRKFTHIFVQDAVSGRKLESIGIGNYTVSGDTRFDRVSQIARSAQTIKLIEDFRSGEKVFIAGSSWPGDEEIIVRYIESHPYSMKWIFAPHMIDAVNIMRLERMLKLKTARYSDAPGDIADARVLIIDNIGLLSSAYRYAHIASVGGGFGKGIHNILEPACWGIPVLFGPNHKKFREAEELINKGGAFCFSNYSEFENIVSELLSDDDSYKRAALRSSEYVSENLGATEKITGAILKKDINK